MIIEESIDFFKKNVNSYLVNGDCIDVLKKIDDKSVHLVLTDPPYNLGQFMHKRNTNLKKMRENQFAYAGWDNLSYDEWLVEMDNFFSETTL